VEDDVTINVVLIPPGTKALSESFLRRSWKHFRDQLVSFLGYCTAALFLLLLFMCWRMFFANPILVISPFSVPASVESPIGLSGKSAANLLLDKVEELSKEANDYGKGGRTAPFLNTEHSEDAPDVKVEVAGFSVEGIVAFASRLLEKQQIVTGELYWVKEGVVIRARLGDGVWTVGPFPSAAADLDKQYRSLAKSLLSKTNPNIAGLIFQKDGEIKLAEESYGRWLSLNGLDANSRAQAYFHLGVARDLIGDRASAEQSYQRALSIQPTLFEALVNLGLDLYTDGNAKEAVERLKQASDVKPGSLAPLMIMGLAQSDPAEKEKTYRKAVALYPEMPEVHYELSQVLRQLNRGKDADAEFKLFSELDAAKEKALQTAKKTQPAKH
jgi:tetratricopeptide (TPR) repeat protein